MNRTEYEAIHGTQVKPVKPCAVCKSRRDVRMLKNKKNKIFQAAKKRGIESGKIIDLFSQDEITGWHYRVDTDMYTGQGGA